ncbi:serum response factor-binding protein 1-like [Anneissia japonica]|uniref:serum response factor-binding protein 1-like n=1 Tax=Anneissia japonica TaxID=1529436 RepID=UPI0014259DC5|nr:serum response factor-binding protein 1-like [Anneissia japonica]
MDRAKLKNEIVLMRNVVKRVKVQVIRQLTRQIKKLRAKKGTKQQVKKNSRRVERLLAELESIKDLVADDISRQAFFGKLTFDIKSQEDDTLKRATARIIQHKIIQERVKLLREQGVLTTSLNLKDLERKKRRKKTSNPTEMLIEKTDVAKNLVDTDNSDENDGNINNTDDDSEEDHNLIDDTRNSSDSNNEVEGNKDDTDRKRNLDTRLKPLDSKTDEISKDFIKRSAVSDFFMGASSNDESDVEKSDNDSDTESHAQTNKHTVTENKKTSKVISARGEDDSRKKEGQIKLKGMRGRREQLEENTRTAFRKRAAEAKAALVDKPNYKVTPTNTEKNILGISDLPPELEQTEFRNKEKSIEGAIPGMKRPYPKQFGDSRFPNTSGHRSTEKPNKKLSGEKLHPSWEAKRKQKEQSSKIVPFQGRKITFDD